CPANIEDDLAHRIRQCAVAAARCIGLRDYGRVDLRVRQSDDAPFVLEVNPNPDLSSECTFARSFCASGGPYSGAINAVVHSAVERITGGRTPLPRSVGIESFNNSGEVTGKGS